MQASDELSSPRRMARNALVAVALACVLALSPSVAFANHTANCSEYGVVHRHMGYLSDRWSDHRYGVRADLDREGLELCTNARPGEGSSSVVWVAIQGPPSLYNIAQIGYGKCYPIAQAGNCNSRDADHDFYAYGRDPASPGCGSYAKIEPTGHWINFWAGGLYTVQEFADHHIELATFHDRIWLSAATTCWANDTVAISSESWDYGDALGNNSAFPVTVSQKQFQTFAGEAWRNLPTACNARRKDGGGALESVFKCFVNGATINLYTSR